MTKGTYTLLIAFDRDATIAVGALDSIAFDAGWYAYTGSAFGPGGFARIDRHQASAAGENETRHWHIDYLLGHPAASIVAVVAAEGVDIECSVAQSLAGDPVPDFGSSDCACDSHLTYATDRDALESSIRRAYQRAQET